jgi:hypothetical protein
VLWRLLNRQPSRLAPLKLCPKSRNANADFNFFRAVPRTQFFHFSRSSFVPSPVVAVSAATPPLVQQKTLLASTAFFASLGVFIVKPHTNALRLFAHFFRRSRACQRTSKTSSKKIEHPVKAYRWWALLNLMCRNLGFGLIIR